MGFVGKILVLKNQPVTITDTNIQINKTTRTGYLLTKCLIPLASGFAGTGDNSLNLGTNYLEKMSTGVSRHLMPTNFHLNGSKLSRNSLCELHVKSL